MVGGPSEVWRTPWLAVPAQAFPALSALRRWRAVLAVVLAGQLPRSGVKGAAGRCALCVQPGGPFKRSEQGNRSSKRLDVLFKILKKEKEKKN